MSGTQPPSFSSFPDAATKPRPQPPSFSSFPELGRPQLKLESTAANSNATSLSSSKRARAADFLDELGQELGVTSTSDSRREHKSRRDDATERNSERHRSRSSKGKDKVSDSDKDSRDHRSRDRDHGRSKKRKDSAAGNAWDRESEYGPQVSLDSHSNTDILLTSPMSQRRKPYQLIQSSADDVPVRSKTPPAEAMPEKPFYKLSSSGDSLNIRYGGLHRGDVPKYRRLGGENASLGESCRCSCSLA